MENKNFNLNYIKCPECKNILDLSFVNKICPNPLCGFDFNGLDAYLNKSDEDLQKILLSDAGYKNRSDREYKLVATSLKYNMGNYLAHFIECNWGAHYNSLYNNFILNFLDDPNVLKIVLKSDIIKEKDNVMISKNGYKMYFELYRRLRKIMCPDIMNFLIPEFPEYQNRLSAEFYEKFIKTRKGKEKMAMNERK